MSDLIVFRGARVVAGDKPPGWLSVPSRWGARDARRVLGRELEAACASRLWPVHRIDEEATGLVLFALDAEAHALLSAAFEHRAVRKV
jgi:tRNA pseudouridine32 synthase/23S rRNA pseudouridine746 synthase